MARNRSGAKDFILGGDIQSTKYLNVIAQAIELIHQGGNHD